MGILDLFRTTTDEVHEARVLVCAVDSRFDDLLKIDSEVYRQYYRATTSAVLPNIQRLLGRLEQKFDIVHPGVGAQFRRLRTRLGPPVATKAMAAKLARLLYRMMRYGMKYADRGAELYDAQYRNQQVTHLKRKAAQLGLQIIELAPAA